MSLFLPVTMVVSVFATVIFLSVFDNIRKKQRWNDRLANVPELPQQWQLKVNDKVLNTRFGPVVLRVCLRARVGEYRNEGFIIFPEGIDWTEVMNSMLGEYFPYNMLIDERLDGIPGSYLINPSYYTVYFKDSLEYEDVHEAVTAVLEGRRPAYPNRH